MIARKLVLFIAALGLLSTGHAKNDGDAPPIRIRALLHDPAQPVTDLFIPDQSGDVVKLDLRRANLSPTQMTKPVNGAIQFYDSDSFDPAKPMENLVASLRVPADLNRVIVILVPNPPDSKFAMHAVLIDDTAKGFPKGESRILSMIPVEVGIQAGEHRLRAEPGKITRIPAVEKRNEFNIAQTSFYYKKDDSWVVFTERQVQYLDKFRRIFLVSVPPGGGHPYITTIVDTAAPVIPGDAGAGR
jgi:hypothetical protein